jgi:hypothetical protein
MERVATSAFHEVAQVFEHHLHARVAQSDADRVAGDFNAQYDEPGSFFEPALLGGADFDA